MTTVIETITAVHWRRTHTQRTHYTAALGRKVTPGERRMLVCNKKIIEMEEVIYVVHLMQGLVGAAWRAGPSVPIL